MTKDTNTKSVSLGEKVFESFICACVAFGLIAGVLWFSGPSPTTTKLKTEAIERGYAQHCPTTGDWVWVGECEGEGQ